MDHCQFYSSPVFATYHHQQQPQQHHHDDERFGMSPAAMLSPHHANPHQLMFNNANYLPGQTSSSHVLAHQPQAGQLDTLQDFVNSNKINSNVNMIMSAYSLPGGSVGSSASSFVDTAEGDDNRQPSSSISGTSFSRSVSNASLSGHSEDRGVGDGYSAGHGGIHNSRGSSNSEDFGSGYTQIRLQVPPNTPTRPYWQMNPRPNFTSELAATRTSLNFGGNSRSGTGSGVPLTQQHRHHPQRLQPNSYPTLESAVSSTSAFANARGRDYPVEHLHFGVIGSRPMQPKPRPSSILAPMTGDNHRFTSGATSGPLIAAKPKVMPPVNNRNYQEARYKTELCLHYREKNECPHAAHCLFAHGLNELRPYRGRHPKHKTQPCKSFHESGYCNYGYRCSYIHLESPRTIRYIKSLNDEVQKQRKFNKQQLVGHRAHYYPC